MKSLIRRNSKIKKVMSTILVVAILCLPLVGCAGETSGAETEITRYTTEGKVTKLIPDETLSGELVVAVLGNEMKWGDVDIDQTNVAVKKFQEIYPNVKITLQRTPYEWTDNNYRENYYTKLSTEVMSGAGPDVFFPDSGAIWDVNKLMRSGTLADLTKFFENDNDFSIKDYNENVFYSGQYSGKQYVVPISYSMPFIISTQEAIDASGFNVDKCKNYISAYEEIARLERDYRAGKSKIQIGTPSLTIITHGYPSFTGLKLTGSISEKIVADTPQVKKMFEIYKELYYDPNPIIMGGDGSEDIPVLLKKEAVLTIQSSLTNIIDMYQQLKDHHATPVVFPWRSMDGKVQAEVYDYLAVNGNSKNKELAYKFIKTYISPAVQCYEEIRDKIIYRDNKQGASILNEANYKLLEERTKPIDGTINNTYFFGKSEAYLSQEFINQFMGYFSETEVTCIGTSTHNRILKEQMKPYLEDKITYEECIKNAQEALELYVSE